ncbi:PP2C family protein-serine/threonine phosphatase [Streptomyces sp. H27-S2]|uniref:PP2C family protein-serine/threonine phosphatase n=1 Tax=Streptomyces antarcticus TaxID=2996458 RepID=UPI0022711052|nr:GAF domain-containing SpoIIE family protein phosphatase [Streptomyces sp. H27-S2]MCY0954068.1 SpoIIE family protein phosphatase [Streptomyces sp. H27-S2]
MAVPEPVPKLSRIPRAPKALVEDRRMEAVRRYDILDTPPDGAFDRVAALAARLFDVPVATVTIVDSDRIWFKATRGLDGVTQIGRDPGLCASAILGDDTLVIPDTLTDPVACANPLVTGALGARFYAAAPIITSDGHRLGTVNILDTTPRKITEADTATLADLAAMVMSELELRLSALRLVRAERERAEVERVMRQQAEKDKAELAAFASTLQRTLLPPALPAIPGMELACHYFTASARAVGGDFYDVFSLGGGRWAFFLGDVCGKGADAAAVTSLTRYTLRAAAWHDPDPVTVLQALNAALLMDPSVGSRFCTAVFGTLEPAAQGGFAVTLGTGGHPPAYHLHPADEGSPAHVDAVRAQGGMLIGAVAGARFASHTVHLAPGQALLLYTDGITEARNAKGELFGDDALNDHLTRHAAACGPSVSAVTLIDDLAALLDTFPDGPGDDVALLALTALPTSPAGPAPTAAATAHTTAGPAQRRPNEQEH